VRLLKFTSKVAFAPNKRLQFNRRAFLRGAGGLALGLPFLESMPERSAYSQSEIPVFSLFLCHSCGVVQDSFWPSQTGALSESTMSGRAVEALGPYASNLLIVKGIKWPSGLNGCGHAQGLCQTLTGAAHNGGGGNSATSTAPSVDTLIASGVNPSGLDPMAMYAGLKGGYINERLSFVSAGQVRSAQGDPYEVYKDLMSQAGTIAAPADQPADPVVMGQMIDEMALRRNSINDLVRDELNSLMSQSVMSQADKQRLQQHLDGIRDIETAMPSGGGTTPSIVGCSADAVPEADFAEYKGRARENGAQEAISLLHLRISAFAFACNLNRTGTIQVGDGTDATVYDVPSNSRRWGFHYVSHRTQSDGAVGNDQTAAAAHAEIDALRMETFKAGLDAFASYTSATGTLLDNSIVMWTNCISDGPSHSFSNIPTVIAGSGGGMLKQGEFVSLGDGGFNGGVTNDKLLNTFKTAAGVQSSDMLDELLA
jgi:hypothetical protein